MNHNASFKAYSNYFKLYFSVDSARFRSSVVAKRANQSTLSNFQSSDGTTCNRFFLHHCLLQITILKTLKVEYSKCWICLTITQCTNFKRDLNISWRLLSYLAYLTFYTDRKKTVLSAKAVLHQSLNLAQYQTFVTLYLKPHFFHIRPLQLFTFSILNVYQKLFTQTACLSITIMKHLLGFFYGSNRPFVLNVCQRL